MPATNSSTSTSEFPKSLDSEFGYLDLELRVFDDGYGHATCELTAVSGLVSGREIRRTTTLFPRRRTK